MITAEAIRARALDLGVLPAQVEKDYALNHVLAALADGDGPLLFRGGTALARVYWPDFRLSEDLDFIASIGSGETQMVLDVAVDAASVTTGLELKLEFGQPRGGWSRSIVRWSPIHGSLSSDTALIIVDVNLDERAYLPIERGRLDLPYQDLAGEDRHIAVVSLPEILGNKWYMLGEHDRNEPRDLFDLWAGLIRFYVSFDQVARGHKEKYSFLPMAEQLSMGKRLEPLWEMRLAHQVGRLPPFEEAFGEVEAAFREWEADRSSSSSR